MLFSLVFRQRWSARNFLHGADFWDRVEIFIFSRCVCLSDWICTSQSHILWFFEFQLVWASVKCNYSILMLATCVLTFGSIIWTFWEIMIFLMSSTFLIKVEKSENFCFFCNIFWPFAQQVGIWKNIKIQSSAETL